MGLLSDGKRRICNGSLRRGFVTALYEGVLDLKHKLENMDRELLDEVDLELIPKLAARLTKDAKSIYNKLKNPGTAKDTIEVARWIVREASEIRMCIENRGFKNQKNNRKRSYANDFTKMSDDNFDLTS